MFLYVASQIFSKFYYAVNLISEYSVGSSLTKGFSTEDYDKKVHYLAQVNTILLRSRQFEFEAPNLKSFVLKHDRFESPEIILEDNVTLMAIDNRFAYFAMVPDNIDVASSNNIGPFFYINQYKHAQYMIKLSVDIFVKMADSIGDPSKLIVISSTGRCGSTLLTQLFENMPDTVAISEPEVLVSFIQGQNKNHWASFSKVKVLQSVVRMLCKPPRRRNENRPKTYVIKTMAHEIAITKDIADIFPRDAINYMYILLVANIFQDESIHYLNRHPSEYIKSVRAVNDSLPSWVQLVVSNWALEMELMILNQFPNQKSSNYDLMKYTYRKHYGNNSNEIPSPPEVNRFASLIAANLLAMQDMYKDSNINFGIVSYHDLKKNPVEQMRKIISHCQLEIESSNAIRTENGSLPSTDSQTNSGLSMKTLQSYKKALNPQEIDSVDRIFKDCGLPTCEKFPIDGETFKQTFLICN